MYGIVYDSLSGMGVDFIEKVLKDYTNKDKYKVMSWEEFTYNDAEELEWLVMQTRCQDIGRTPFETLDFIDEFKDEIEIKGTFVTGSKNWGEHYGGSAYEIEETFKIPSLLIYEGRGFNVDVQKARLILRELEEGNTGINEEILVRIEKEGIKDDLEEVYYMSYMQELLSGIEISFAKVDNRNLTEDYLGKLTLLVDVKAKRLNDDNKEKILKRYDGIVKRGGK